MKCRLSTFTSFFVRDLKPIKLSQKNKSESDWVVNFLCTNLQHNTVLLTFTLSPDEKIQSNFLSNVENMLSEAKIDRYPSDDSNPGKLDLFTFEADGPIVRVTTTRPKVFVSQLANSNILSEKASRAAQKHIERALRTMPINHDEGNFAPVSLVGDGKF